VVISQTEGNKKISRTSRIGYVTDNGVVYSDWSTDDVRYIPIIKDKNPNIDLSMIKSMYLEGSFKSGLLPMKNVGESKWKLDSLNLKAGQKYTLKFIQSKSKPRLEWGGATGLSGKAVEKANNAISFSTDKDGFYSVIFDQSALSYVIQKTPTLTLSIVGDATSIGWDPKGLPMQQSVDDLNNFTWTGQLSASNNGTEGKFKFHSGSNGFCDDVWLYSTFADQSLSDTTFTKAEGCTSADNKWKVQAGETGTYTITINLKTKRISITKKQ
jgi:hypothetical protein